MQAKIMDTLNARSYATFFSIATTALSLIKKTSPNTPSLDNLSFSVEQLRIICFDNLFAAYENFLEHIGFLLFEKWESDGEEKGYNNKLKKLKNLTKITLPTLLSANYASLESEWLELLRSIDIKKYNGMRNRIKHTHSGKHDGKIINRTANVELNTVPDVATLNEDTIFDITDNHCQVFFDDVNSFIKGIHDFLKSNKGIFNVHQMHGDTQQPKNLDAIKQRNRLFSVFCVNPLQGRMYTESASLIHE